MKRTILILAMLLWAGTLHATQYFIDFATGADTNNGTAKGTPWKRAPGMTGCANNCATYSHSAGDQFIFKGGVTWDSTIAQWAISNSGTNGNNDYYGVDKTWYAGGSWVQPIFDGGSKNPPDVQYGYFFIEGNYITLDNLKLQNIGTAGVSPGNYAVWIENHHDILIENMSFATESWLSIYLSQQNSGTISNFEFKNNDFTKCSMGVAGAVTVTGAVISNLLIHDNWFHDFHDQLASSQHGNGVYLWSSSGTDATEYFDQVSIYNNSFYGDFSSYTPGDSASHMSSFIWPGATAAGTAYVYNNHITYSAANNIGGAFLAGGTFSGFTPTGSVYLYNNSMILDANTNYFLYSNGVGTLTVENNAIVGSSTYAYTVGATVPVTTFISDYNDFYNWTGGSSFAVVGASNYTYTQFKAIPQEAHGLNTSPLFVSSTDLHLQAGSPLIGQGVNLSAVFTTDAAGAVRTVPWDMGAYIPGVTPPQAPLMINLLNQ